MKKKLINYFFETEEDYELYKPKITFMVIGIVAVIGFELMKHIS